LTALEPSSRMRTGVGRRSLDDGCCAGEASK
jgi:hypothetical protein